MFWCGGFFTIGGVDEVTSFWEEDSLPIWLQAVPLAVRDGEGPLSLVYLLVEIQPLRPELACFRAKFCNYCYNYF